MQLTNVQVLNALQGLNTISQNKLPIRLAWKVTTAIRSLQDFAKSEFSLSDFPETMELEPSTLTLLTPILKDEPVQELKLIQ